MIKLGAEGILSIQPLIFIPDSPVKSPIEKTSPLWDNRQDAEHKYTGIHGLSDGGYNGKIQTGYSGQRLSG